MKENTSYLNSGNFFSKSIFLQKSIKRKNSLMIVESSRELEIYKKIFDFIKFEYKALETLENLSDIIFNKSGFFIADLSTINNINIKKEQLEYLSLKIEKNKSYNFEEITKKLIDLNYKFSEFGSPGTFKKNGDIIKVVSGNDKNIYEISFWGDDVEDITLNKKSIEIINIGKNNKIESKEEKKENFEGFINLIDKETFIILDNLNFSRSYEILTEELENFSCFDYVENDNLKKIDLGIDIPKIKDTNELKKIFDKKEVIFYTKNSNTIKNFLEYNNIKKYKIIETNINVIKSFENEKEVKICDDIIRVLFTKKRLKKNISTNLDLLLKIKPGDYVVHIEHGIGIFNQIIKREIKEKNKISIKEYIEIQYLGEDKLFVPIVEVSRVNKYLGIENPKLTSLGGTSWENKIKKAKKEAESIANELIEIYANRKINKGFSFLGNKEKENEFKNSFPYVHTQDQDTIIEEILNDMQNEEPMDRLIVGDVGFGKTEIAFNSIYRSFINKKQSIMIVPLVVLAYEHFEKAKKRFEKYGVKIGILTRLESERQESITIQKIASGEIDLVIGTHKLLSDKIVYKDLGLIVTDEEHKFGVSDKEKIKEFKTNIDSLAMSATPIPRSLNMALSKIRQISIIKTAPIGRKNIDTTINRFSEKIIESAGKIEFDRNGQMFFVHNRVANIENIKKTLLNIFPDKKIVITHGKLPGMELEKRIIEFKNKKFDILLSTTAIENGIDFQNVNTIIINNAENFGLSQIHQLRGRVGRSDKKGYCHLLYKSENVKPDTAKRLKTIVEYSYLGAGMELAMKDLEIRGGGDLLGFRQSGQASQIGINLYLKIIEEKILDIQKSEEKKDGLKISKINTKIDLDIEIFIEDNFFGSELDKINFYREIELIEDLEELNNIKIDLIQGKNKIPNSIENLFNLLELKLLSKTYLIEEIKKVGINYQIDFYKDIKIEELKKFLDKDKEVKFKVIKINRVRSSIKNFANNKNFIEYMLSLLKSTNLKSKIKLKCKRN